MTFVPMQCPYCDAVVRGDEEVCPACGEEISTTWSKGEQEIEDREARGECVCCGRVIELCEADPCFL